MFLALFLTCFSSLVLTTVLVLSLGHRLRWSSRLVGMLTSLVFVVVAGEVAARVWRLPSGYVLSGEVLLAVVCAAVVLARPRWNPIGQAFYGTILASAAAYLAFAAWYTGFGGLSVPGMAASAALLLLETVALLLSAWYAFDSLDVMVRARWDRPIDDPDPEHRPMVSLQIAAYNEPPDMLIETIKSVEAIDYPDFEVVVIDNNTKDPDVWSPVEEYCRDRPRVKFVHVDDWPGFKAGALNLALTEHTDPKAELVGVVDADYLLDPDYLKSVVGYFADPDLAFLQTPQDYREYERDPYLTACYDAYEYFFATTMPSRNERNSIIFAGTMGLIRRSVIEKLGGWEEWCITEDAEASLRILMAGFSGLYIRQSFGRGIMPLTFAALKSQRFRWCFGGIQILKRHWRDLVPWNRDPENRLSVGQRLDYLFGSLHWMNDLVYLGFSVALLATAAVLVVKGDVGIRPLLGTAVLLPAALIGSGLLRALWALRKRVGIGVGRALRAFANWLSMSWTVALACLQALFRSEAVFLRTPKSEEHPGLLDALRAARAETTLSVLLLAAAVVVAARGQGTPFVLGLFVWQGAVYATAPYMAWLNQHTSLPEQLERRRRTEWLRDRLSGRWPYVVGAATSLVALAVLAGVFVLGGANPGRPSNPFTVSHRAPGDRGPLSNLVKGGPVAPAPSPSPTPVPSGSPSPEPTSSTSPSPEPTETSSPSPTESPSPSPSG